MANNPNTRLNNRHLLAVATSGGGKTTFIKQLDELKKSGRVLAWDPDEDHRGRRYENRAAFARAVKSAVKSGKRFRLCLTVDATRENFEWFCRVAWAILDGSKETSIIVEEVADVVPQGKAPPAWGMLLRRGRKYGAVIYAVTQRPAEADKTVYSQTARKWVGVLENEIDRKRLSSLIDVSQEKITALKPLEYAYKEIGKAAVFGKLRIRKNG